MGLGQVVLAVNTAGTLAIGVLCFFIVYTTFKGLEDQKIQEFSKRFMMAIAILILYVSYLMSFQAFKFLNTASWGRYPMYLLLVAVFIYLIYAAVGFERVAESYGVSQSSKLEKMEKEEMS